MFHCSYCRKVNIDDIKMELTNVDICQLCFVEIHNSVLLSNKAIAKILNKAIDKRINECPCGIHPDQCDYHRGV
jgi:hypothetical protein